MSSSSAPTRSLSRSLRCSTLFGAAATTSLALVLTACSTSRVSSPGMVSGSTSAIALDDDDTPPGVGYNQPMGEVKAQMPQTIHYHTHYHGDSSSGGSTQSGPPQQAAGYSQERIGAPVQNGNLGKYDNGPNGGVYAPIGTGGGGAGWYGPTGAYQGPQSGGFRQQGYWAAPNANGYNAWDRGSNWNGYTD